MIDWERQEQSYVWTWNGQLRRISSQKRHWVCPFGPIILMLSVGAVAVACCCCSGFNYSPSAHRSSIYFIHRKPWRDGTFIVSACSITCSGSLFDGRVLIAVRRLGTALWLCQWKWTNIFLFSRSLRDGRNWSRITQNNDFKNKWKIAIHVFVYSIGVLLNLNHVKFN